MSLYPQVEPKDFMKFGGDKPSHLLIEEALIRMGGAGSAGSNFKNEILKMAGWTGGKLTTYASRADLAAKSFNRIRLALESAKTAEELKTQLLH